MFSTKDLPIRAAATLAVAVVPDNTTVSADGTGIAPIYGTVIVGASICGVVESTVCCCGGGNGGI